MPKDYLRERISEIIGEVPNKNVVVDRFIETYNAPYRKYHNMNHIVKCLDSISYAIPIFDNYRIEGENLIQIAILYHDYVYNPLATNNELYSTSAIKRDFSFSHINREKREMISNMIMATTHNPKMELTIYDKYICDVDLHQLGSGLNEFLLNENNIREEYHMIPDEIFYPGRSKILQGFLDRDNIYYIKGFGNKFESNARRNIKYVLDRIDVFSVE